jgi:hypothetical protein
MNKWVFPKSTFKPTVLRRFCFTNPQQRVTVDPKLKIKVQEDKDPNIAAQAPKDTPIKESKINEYFRDKIKKFDGRLN